MQIKTYQAPDMREALRAVKEELGPDAVILSTRQVKNGDQMFGLFNRPFVEVTAAVDRSCAQQAPAARPTPRFSEHLPTALAVRPQRDDLAGLREEVRSGKGRNAPPPAGDGAKAGTLGSMEEELRNMRRVVGSLLTSEREQLIERLPRSLLRTHDRLIERGLDRDSAMTVVRTLQALVPSRDLESGDRLERALREHLSRQVKTAGSLLDPQGAPRAVMIVGPTGVGKTTTIAKLAALYSLKRKRSVALITLDTYRVAAVEQLRVYANILKLPVDVARTVKDLAAFLEARKHTELILIDTAGRSPRDEAALNELGHLLAFDRRIEAHLVLSAATRESDLEAIAARFASLPVRRLVFSKLDETTQYGPIFTLAQRTGMPVSYLCTGQCVPDDLDPATPASMADLLLDGLTGLDGERSSVGRARADAQKAGGGRDAKMGQAALSAVGRK